MGQIKKIIIHDHARWSLARNRKQCKEYRGGSRGRVQGVRTPPEMTCGFLIQLVFCKKSGLLVLK